MLYMLNPLIKYGSNKITLAIIWFFWEHVFICVLYLGVLLMAFGMVLLLLGESFFYAVT